MWRSPILLLGLLGCTNGEPAHDLTAEEFVRARSAAICDSLLLCPEQLHAVYPSDLALAMTVRCADDATDGTSEELAALLSRGHTEADPREAERCLRAIATCNLAESRCERALVGTLAGGEPCMDDEECSSGHCDGGFDTCGQCSPVTALAMLGEECRSSIDCEQPQDMEVQCLSDAEFRSTCTQVVTVRVGESCADPGRICEAGAHCDRAGTCRLPVAARKACVSGERCAPGALCAKVAGGHYCVPVARQKRGEPCSGDDFDVADDGTFQRCDRTLDLRCDEATRTCVQLSRAESGESCDGQPCQEGLFCDETGRCTARKLVGQDCRGGLECESYRCKESVCVALDDSPCE